MIVDSHCHAAENWYQPVDSLLFEMDAAGVERALLIQVLGRQDNRYQAACVARFPDRLASVVAIDEHGPHAVAQLEALAAEGCVGVRLRPATRSSGQDPLALWRAVERLGLPVSCAGTARAFVAPDFAALLADLPGLTVVLEHLGGIARPDLDVPVEQVLDLARFPNLRLKIPGLGQLATRPSSLPPEGPPFDIAAAAEPISRAAQAFGPGRLMWGSDFPLAAGREGYRNALTWTRRSLAYLGDEAISAMFGGAAARVFNL